MNRPGTVILQPILTDPAFTAASYLRTNTDTVPNFETVRGGALSHSGGFSDDLVSCYERKSGSWSPTLSDCVYIGTADTAVRNGYLYVIGFEDLRFEGRHLKVFPTVGVCVRGSAFNMLHYGD